MSDWSGHLQTCQSEKKHIPFQTISGTSKIWIEEEGAEEMWLSDPKQKHILMSKWRYYTVVHVIKIGLPEIRRKQFVPTSVITSHNPTKI